MIQPSFLIEYMRQNRSSDTWKIDYSATYQVATERSKLPLPCFYVEIGETSATNESVDDYYQRFSTLINVRLVCLTGPDRMGRVGADIAYIARLELLKILDNQILDPKFDRLTFTRDGFENYDEARYVHQFQFTLTGQIDLDFTRVGSGVDLKSIYIDYNLADSAIIEQPNAQSIINTLQD